MTEQMGFQKFYKNVLKKKVFITDATIDILLNKYHFFWRHIRNLPILAQ